jgi:hypothetical protein
MVIRDLEGGSPDLFIRTVSELPNESEENHGNRWPTFEMVVSRVFLPG